MQSAPTHDPGRARTAQCRGARWAVSWPPPRSCSACAQSCRHAHARVLARLVAVSRPAVSLPPPPPPPHTRRDIENRVVIQLLLRVLSASCGRAHTAVSSTVSHAVSRPKRSPPATIQFLYRDSPRPCARAVALPVRRLALS